MRPARSGETGLPATSPERDRKSTRLNSSHLVISYAVFCLKKKKRRGRDGQRHLPSADDRPDVNLCRLGGVELPGEREGAAVGERQSDVLVNCNVHGHRDGY